VQSSSRKCGFAVSLNSHDAAAPRVGVLCSSEAQAGPRKAATRRTAAPLALHRWLARVAEGEPGAGSLREVLVEAVQLQGTGALAPLPARSGEQAAGAAAGPPKARPLSSPMSSVPGRLSAESKDMKSVVLSGASAPEAGSAAGGLRLHVLSGWRRGTLLPNPSLESRPREAGHLGPAAGSQAHSPLPGQGVLPRGSSQLER
jgi:hypothetical protein